MTGSRHDRLWACSIFLMSIGMRRETVGDGRAFRRCLVYLVSSGLPARDPPIHTTGTGRDERLSEAPQLTHSVTPARPHPKIPSPWETSATREGHAFDEGTPVHR